MHAGGATQEIMIMMIDGAVCNGNQVLEVAPQHPLEANTTCNIGAVKTIL